MQVEAIHIDPVARQVKRIRLPVPSVLNETTRFLLMGAAVSEGAGEDEMVSVSHFLSLTSPIDVNAYTIWQHTGSRYVLMLGDKTGHRHGFRIGRRRCKATVFWGPGVLLRYEDVSHLYGNRHEIRPGCRPFPKPKVLKPQIPQIEWQEGDHSEFSGAGGDFEVVRSADGVIEQRTLSHKSCAACGRNIRETPKKCAQCQNVYYCSKDCQIDHWKSHKTTCNSGC